MKLRFPLSFGIAYSFTLASAADICGGGVWLDKASQHLRQREEVHSIVGGTEVRQEYREGRVALYAVEKRYQGGIFEHI